MTMEFGSLSKVTLGEAVTSAATEGGSVVAGLLGAGFLGKLVEKNLGTAGSKNALPTSSITDKGIAWLVNNGPKVGLWYLLKKEGRVLGGYEKDVEKGIVASVVLDTVVRAGNRFAPKSLLKIGKYDVLSGEEVKEVTTMSEVNPQLQANLQQVIQENSSLRGQLNQALGRLASIPSAQPQITVTPMPPGVTPHGVTSTGGVQVFPEGFARRREFGVMESPATEERHRKFGYMGNLNVNTNKSVGAMFGMD